MTAPGLAVSFPAPPREIRRAVEQLRQAEDAGLAPTGVHLLDRPWDPASCSPHVRAQLWPWLDDVAGWLNHTFAWQTVHAIPSCWPAHPSLVHELAALACLRIAAADATGPQPLEEWHRYALPAFHARMAERLGLGCPPGRHTDWPARSWAADYDSPHAIAWRRELFTGDRGHPSSTRDTPRPAEGRS